VITTPPAGLHANDPNVSPDGAELSFEAENEAGKHALFVVDMDGSGLIKLVPAFSDVATKADWSPDGGRIIFSVNANEPSRVANVASIRPDGTGLRYLTDFPTPEQRAYAGSFSPDGRWIVFRFQDGGRYGLYRTGPEGGALHPILPLSDLLPTGNDWGASVTPS
jgi:Tol biopolymer transport system component